MLTAKKYNGTVHVDMLGKCKKKMHLPYMKSLCREIKALSRGKASCINLDVCTAMFITCLTVES